MNLFQLVTKQMRQRALSTWLTLLSVLLGVALVIAIMILRREGRALFGQSEFGYDVLVGARGSSLSLVVNTVYHIDQSPGNIPYSLYEQLRDDPQYEPYVKMAIPYGVGDSFEGYRIVATIPAMFGYDDAGQPLPAEDVFEYRPGRRFEVEGRVFHGRKFEAVIGSEVAQRTNLKIGSKFKATHGLPQPNEEPDIHEQQWTVVGILKPTHTAEDRVLFIPLPTYYAIREHEEAMGAISKIRQGADISEAVAGGPQGPASAPATAQTPHDEHEGDADHDHDDHAAEGHAEAHDEHEHDAGAPASTTAAAAAPQDAHAHHDHDHAQQYTLNPDGTINLHLPKDEWMLSAVLVRSRGFPEFGTRGAQLAYMLKTRDEAQAVSPAQVMREFFDNFLAPSSWVLLLISLLVTVVASVGILVSIYNSVSARLKEIAVLRALGATRRRVLGLICLEAGLIGLLGAVIGFAVGHGLAAGGSAYMSTLFGEGIRWARTDWIEIGYLLLVVVLAVLAGLVPAMKAYRTPVATNLMAG